MNETRGFKGVWIPAELWLDENLSKMEMLFLTEIDSLDNENGCFAGNDYFENFFRLSKSRCSEIISSLKVKKYITIEYEYEGKEIIKRTIRVLNKYKKSSPLRKTEHKNHVPPSENRTTPSENTKDINTFNNTDIPNSDEFETNQKLPDKPLKPKKQKTPEQELKIKQDYEYRDRIILLLEKHGFKTVPDKNFNSMFFALLKTQSIDQIEIAINNYFECKKKEKDFKYTINGLFRNSLSFAHFANMKSNDPNRDLPESIKRMLRESKDKQ